MPHTASGRESAPVPDPYWYKDAVIYELHVKAFADANGDGIGDLRGLTQRLDHVQSLGVNTIWLLPFYPSPLRDDGYDVADYDDVHPSYGSLDDFRHFVEEAHRRQLRVITELVVNHTSDQHPWFQAARRAPKGSAERNFYVWSDDPGLYAGTRIIFTDTEKSNWSWDELAQAWYWHRFFSHQPDLNFDNPAVLEAVLASMAFWLDMGVDGFRLDAVPYLVERDGTSCENLRETHDVIKTIRRRIDARYPGRLLLAEANMWPEDVREYFGDDDECHMAYHFPLMPRMYMAIALEDRHPVVEILAQTPDIPPHCQWAIFLRNHDELTLEMVTSKERDYLYRTYAEDPRARINLGIRRRLAPLLENDRARIELMNSLLLSMPGTPVLYYGDEIGMGDNIFLGDRDGVRTPMQWTRDRNGGFSNADPQRLYLPPIQDPVYGYEALNVEAQTREPSSLLNWMRRLLAIRSTTQAFGRGRFTMLHPGNRKVLAYVREHGDDTILCVANVSRSAQAVELELRMFKGRVPVEMAGRNAFPPIGDLPYLLTLPAYGFFWFRLSADAMPPRWHAETLAVDELPTLVLFDGWNSLFRQRVVPWRMRLAETTRKQFEEALLPAFIGRQRWQGGPGAVIQRAVLTEHALLDAPGQPYLLAVAEVTGTHISEGTSGCFLPLALAFDSDNEERARVLGALPVCRVRQQAETGLIADAMADEAFGRTLVAAIGASTELRTDKGFLRFTPAAGWADRAAAALSQPLPVHRLTAHVHSVSLLGDHLFLKAFRQLTVGLHPELELGRYLTEIGFAHSVPLLGSVEHEAADGTVRALAILQVQVHHQGDAWQITVDSLARLLEGARAADATPDDSLDAMAGRIALIAQRLAALHAALARATGLPAFVPEPLLDGELAGWLRQAEAAWQSTLDSLTPLLRPPRNRPRPPEALRTLATELVAVGPQLRQHIQRALRGLPAQRKQRVHGDMHLAQVLTCRDDVVFTGFDGEPLRSSEERRAKQSPLRDVASLLRSLAYARHAALQQAAPTDVDAVALALLAQRWEQRMREAFVSAYRSAAVDAGLFADAAGFDALAPLLHVFELERAMFEARFEVERRPDWVAVPLSGIVALARMNIATD
ncbi:MAG: maltose alpha-D-glucosyltransferase [Rubrivivax sp.]|nr:maltose alpha-D-glucosyltransferase [Rubrivivax sp.]